MDELVKLQKKNEAKLRESKRLAGKELLEYVAIALGLSPLLFSYAYGFYFWFNRHEIELNQLWVALGTLSFGLPALFLINFQLFKPTVKLLLLFICVAWFSYFWVVVYLSWYAFTPLIILYGLLLKIRKAISKKLNDDI